MNTSYSKIFPVTFAVKLAILLSVFFFCISNAYAQKFGYVDSELILKKMPEYKAAQQEIDGVSVNYQKEIEGMTSQLDSMYQAYRKEEILLTEEMKQKKKNAIIEKEKSIKAYQRKIFGFEGLIFLKRQELIKPVQDKLFEAVERVSKRHKLQFVFDKSGDLTMIYANPIHDYTDLVLETLDLISEKEKK